MLHAKMAMEHAGLVLVEQEGTYPLPRKDRIVYFMHLNAFRGVRAISEFDWPFTPIHKCLRQQLRLQQSMAGVGIVGAFCVLA